MNAKTTKETSSKNQKSISANPEIVERFRELSGDKSNTDFLTELLEAYELLNGLKNSDEPENYFPNLQGKDKADKEPVIKEIFGLDKDDPIKCSEDELLKKACEYSKKSMVEMALEGRVLVAKNEIGRQIQYKLGRGKIGMADERIGDTLKLLLQMGQKLTVNRLTQASGSNRKSVESWLEREEIKINGTDLDKDSVSAWCEKN
jgi:hypothetical protein